MGGAGHLVGHHQQHQHHGHQLTMGGTPNHSNTVLPPQIHRVDAEVEFFIAFAGAGGRREESCDCYDRVIMSFVYPLFESKIFTYDSDNGGWQNQIH